MKTLISVPRILDRFVDLVFGQPSHCALCGREHGAKGRSHPGLGSSGICGPCLDRLSRQMAWVCQICGTPLKPPLRNCPDCQKFLYTFDGQRSAGIYEGDLKSAVIRMKFQGERWLSRPLGWLVADAAQEFLPVDMVVPIPLEPKSRIRRGYNQAMDLAKEVAKLVGVPTVDILNRDARSSHQAELGRSMRWGNLRESMGPKRPVGLDAKTCLLVDDVTTTGATLDEAARVLKRMGAQKVFCATVARTLRH